MRQTVVGVFDRMSEAQRAAELLRERGIADADIHLTASDDGGGSEISSSSQVQPHERSLLDRIRDFFSGVGDDEDVSVYSEHVRRGGAVVKVDVDDEPRTEAAREALESAGAVDIDERVSEWQAGGWNPESRALSDAEDQDIRRATVSSASSTGTDTSTLAATSGASSTGSDDVIPVVREEVQIGKRTVRAGGVRVYARVVEEPVRESVELREERAKVDRRPVDRPASASDLEALGERSVEIEETVERPVVAKSARVVEEVVVGKEVRNKQAQIEEAVRHTEVEVQDMGGDTGSLSQRAYEDFRSDFATRYGSGGSERWEDHEPAYRYGHGLAGNSRYGGQDWDTMEPGVRSDWEREHPGSTWDKVKSSVRHAWERARS